MANARVAIIMGSQSDWSVMRSAEEALEALGITSDVRIISAHRTPERLTTFIREAEEGGIEVIIAGAGCAAHLAGVTAAQTMLPVLGVPLEGSALNGLDALLATVQMPGGIPVATFAIGKAGAKNAALFAGGDHCALRQRGARKARQVPRYPIGGGTPRAEARLIGESCGFALRCRAIPFWDSTPGWRILRIRLRRRAAHLGLRS